MILHSPCLVKEPLGSVDGLAEMAGYAGPGGRNLIGHRKQVDAGATFFLETKTHNVDLFG